jgi:hypothetical protein
MTTSAVAVPLQDTAPPSAINGLVAGNAYDKRVNLWWDKTEATDFDHYNLYIAKTEITDVTGMKAVQQITNIAKCTNQVTGLDDGTKYYFALTAVDKSGNEGVKVTSVSTTPVPMPKGTTSTDLAVDSYQADKVWAGTTLLTLNYDPNKRRIVEVNMLGEVIWEYAIPQRGTTEAELLPNNNILYSSDGEGVFEINRSGKIVWQYLTTKVNHDADRLPNGNTLFIFAGDQKSDAQVTEVNPDGKVVWQWYAKDYFDKPPYSSISSEDGGYSWTHCNAVTRLTNGNTLISLRNFDMVVEVDPKGTVIRTIGEGIFDDQHDPEILANGNLLVANHNLRQYKGKPQRALEFNPETNKIIWEYLIADRENYPVRDANRLPNGNTLITGSTEIVEVTPQGEIVWRLKLQGVSLKQQTSGFYKADRVSAQK